MARTPDFQSGWCGFESRLRHSKTSCDEGCIHRSWIGECLTHAIQGLVGERSSPAPVCKLVTGDTKAL
jgi:hypothetical protein